MAYSPKYAKKKNARRGWMFDLLMAVFACLLLIGGGMFLRNRMQSRADQKAFRELAALVDRETGPTSASTPAGETAAPEEPAVPTEDPAAPYRILQEQNPDFVAWLTVPGTKIDYPVMHTPEDIEHYIYRAFDGSHSPSGTPFVGDYGSLEENRCVIYGHNMGDGTMFAELELYGEKAFWEEHASFTITTVEERREYEIFAAVRTRLLRPEERGIRYYRLEDGVEEWLREKALYDTGIEAREGDEIVILSTCTYHTENGRFILAGRRIS